MRKDYTVSVAQERERQTDTNREQEREREGFGEGAGHANTYQFRITNHVLFMKGLAHETRLRNYSGHMV